MIIALDLNFFGTDVNDWRDLVELFKKLLKNCVTLHIAAAIACKGRNFVLRFTATGDNGSQASHWLESVW